MYHFDFKKDRKGICEMSSITHTIYLSGFLGILLNLPPDIPKEKKKGKKGKKKGRGASASSHKSTKKKKKK